MLHSTTLFFCKRVLFSSFGRLWVTVGIGFLSVALDSSWVLVGLLMTSRSKVVRAILRMYLEVDRVMPQLVLLYVVLVPPGWFGANLDGLKLQL